MSALMAPLCVGTPDPRLLAPGLAPLVEGPGSRPSSSAVGPLQSQPGFLEADQGNLSNLQRQRLKQGWGGSSPGLP